MTKVTKKMKTTKKIVGMGTDLIEKGSSGRGSTVAATFHIYIYKAFNSLFMGTKAATFHVIRIYIFRIGFSEPPVCQVVMILGLSVGKMRYN